MHKAGSNAEANAIFNIVLSAYLAGKDVTRILDTAASMFEQWAARKQVRDTDDKLQRMVDLMVDVARERGECTNHDLLAAGFTHDDLRRFGPMASGLAAVTITNGQRGGRA